MTTPVATLLGEMKRRAAQRKADVYNANLEQDIRNLYVKLIHACKKEELPREVSQLLNAECVREH